MTDQAILLIVVLVLLPFGWWMDARSRRNRKDDV